GPGRFARPDLPIYRPSGGANESTMGLGRADLMGAGSIACRIWLGRCAAMAAQLLAGLLGVDLERPVCDITTASLDRLSGPLVPPRARRDRRADLGDLPDAPAAARVALVRVSIGSADLLSARFLLLTPFCSIGFPYSLWVGV